MNIRNPDYMFGCLMDRTFSSQFRGQLKKNAITHLKGKE